MPDRNVNKIRKIFYLLGADRRQADKRTSSHDKHEQWWQVLKITQKLYRIKLLINKQFNF